MPIRSWFGTKYVTDSEWTDSGQKRTVYGVDTGKRALRRLGKRIQEIRRQQGWSQEEFAEEVGLARSYMSGVERGKRNLSFGAVARIASGLGLSIAKLCDGV